MTVAKTLGIETEYGIVLRGTEDPSPILASSLLINAYLAYLAGDEESREIQRVSWDFADESPARDARGETPLHALAPEIETHLVNAVLTNGARYYVDHAHPEYSTPECADPLSVVIHDRAGEEVLIESMKAANAVLGPGQEIVVYKNNSDGKGNSYGCHENYLMDRATPFGQIVQHGISHLITRQIFTGAGKVGTELPGFDRSEIPFQLTQRADFFEEQVGLETTLKRPIINTRDEPHADARKYRRLHVIAGDANMSEVATFLKVGTTAIVLTMVEAGAIGRPFQFADPVHAMQQISFDLTLRKTVALKDGTRIRPIEVQRSLFEDANRFIETNGVEHVGGEVAHDVMNRWEFTLDALESDPMKLSQTIDWVAKYRLFEAYRERHNLDWSNARISAMDIQYHDIRPGRSLAYKLDLERLANPDDVDRAKSYPPEDTRAYFRGECLRKWPDDIVAANWDSLVFDVGTDPLRRIPMMEPTRGTRAHVGTVIAESETPRELLERLDG